MITLTDLIYKLVALTIRAICRINGGLEVKGKENIPNEGGVLVAANHISYLDPPLIGAVVPRRATFMARKGLFEIPVLRWMIKNAAFPVDRERTRPSTIKETVKRLKRGELITIFPEGRRSDTGKLMEAKRGVGMLSAMSRAPVVPALIIGTDKALPAGAKWLKRAQVTVVFGKPIEYTSISVSTGAEGQQLHEEVSRKVMTAIGQMQDRYGN